MTPNKFDLMIRQVYGQKTLAENVLGEAIIRGLFDLDAIETTGAVTAEQLYSKLGTDEKVLSCGADFTKDQFMDELMFLRGGEYVFGHLETYRVSSMMLFAFNKFKREEKKPAEPGTEEQFHQPLKGDTVETANQQHNNKEVRGLCGQALIDDVLSIKGGKVKHPQGAIVLLLHASGQAMTREQIWGTFPVQDAMRKEDASTLNQVIDIENIIDELIENEVLTSTDGMLYFHRDFDMALSESLQCQEKTAGALEASLTVYGVPMAYVEVTGLVEQLNSFFSFVPQSFVDPVKDNKDFSMVYRGITFDRAMANELTAKVRVHPAFMGDGSSNCYHMRAGLEHMHGDLLPHACRSEYMRGDLLSPRKHYRDFDLSGSYNRSGPTSRFADQGLGSSGSYHSGPDGSMQGPFPSSFKSHTFGQTEDPTKTPK